MGGPRIEWMGGSAESREALEQLLFDVLYRDFGVAWDGAWRIDDPGSQIAVAWADAQVPIGIVRLLPMNTDGTCQIRQLAVAAKAQGIGVGRLLMAVTEARAASWGADGVWLHARESAFPFYERLGYAYASEVFVSKLTGIPHRTMRKAI